MKQGFQFSAATHVRMQFTRHFRSKKLVTGTQKLDGFWKLLKKFVAPQLRTRDPENRRVAKHVLDTVKSFMFRQLWMPTLESAWQVGERKREIFFLQMTVKIHGKHSQHKKGCAVSRLPCEFQLETLTPATSFKYHDLSSEPLKKRCVFPRVANHAVA